jgi:hypothetical protein
MRRRLICSLLLVTSVATVGAQERTGEQIYRATCVACHGIDGKGQKQALLGFEPPDSFPDFTDCPVASSEPDAIWNAVIHRGGRVRGLSRIMPAFEDLLTDAEIDRLVQYLHSFCAEPRWPRGQLNFPRTFFTEKAFPENETVITFEMVPSHPRSIETKVGYEKRFGPRAQFEFTAPFVSHASPAGGGAPWSRGLGDVTAALKYALYDSYERGSILSAGGEVKLPTGKENEGLGGGVTVLEAFGLYGQALPRDAFVQLHVGFESPTDRAIEPRSTFWRVAAGKTITPRRFGRIWTPMVELLGARELVKGAGAEWDVVPQMQVSLNVFQHIRLNVGMRLPVTDRRTRDKAFLTYILWDWADGGLFDLWKADQ